MTGTAVDEKRIIDEPNGSNWITIETPNAAFVAGSGGTYVDGKENLRGDATSQQQTDFRKASG